MSKILVTAKKKETSGNQRAKTTSLSSAKTTVHPALASRGFASHLFLVNYCNVYAILLQYKDITGGACTASVRLLDCLQLNFFRVIIEIVCSLVKNAIFTGATCTICNVFHGWSRGQKNEQQNNAHNPKKTMQLQVIRVQ